MQSYQDYIHIRETAAAKLQRVAAQLELLGGNAKAVNLSKVRRRLLSDDFRILFCGEFKRGKR